MISSFLRRIGGARIVSLVGPLYVPVDRWLGRVSRGGRLFAFGLPSLMITTTGRKSGQPRTNPLLYAADGDGFVVIGSNWGKTHHPAWSGNLLANPLATVSVKGTEVQVRATLTAGEERERLRALLLKVWPGYTSYEKRAQGRDLRIFRLDRV